MSNKINKKALLFLVICIVGLQGQIIHVNGQSTKDKQVSKNVWTLTQWNEASDVQWWSKGIFIHASVGSQVIYNVTSSTDNVTDPNSGTFSIGNATNIQTDNYDLANQFALSIYPWSPGFLINPNNWTYNVQQAKDSAAAISGTIKVTNGIANASKNYRESYQFIFNQSLTTGNQNTTLIYDTDTGVLIYAYSEFFFTSLYKIELELSSSTLITSSNYQTTPGFSVVFPLAILITGIVLKKKKILFK